jgi:two-component system, sensor histidine kinase and response regulator
MDDIYTNKNFSSVSEISVYNLVNVLADAAFFCDRSGCIVACSDEVVPFFGLTDKARVIGSSFQSFIAYEHIDEAHFEFLNAVNEPNSRKSGKFLVKKGLAETFYANITFASIANETVPGKYILVTFREAPMSNREIEILHKKDVRLSRLYEIIIDFTQDPFEKNRKLLSQIGETLGATTCSYNRIENDELNPVFSWESPFNKGISPLLGSKQIFDYLTDHNEALTLIRKPDLTHFLNSEPLYNEDSGVKAILGFTIKKNNVVEGILTAVFTFHYSLPDNDKQFIQTIIKVIGNENAESKPVTISPEVSFREMIDCIVDPVFIISSEGIFMEVNKSAAKKYGFEREKLIGQTLSLLSAEERNDNKLIQQLFEKALEGELQQFEWWAERRNGEIFPTEVFLNKSSYYGHDVVIAIIRDLSESRKEIDDLQRQNLELKESNRSKDKFFGIFAHDLKNPFQGLLGFIDLLYEDLDELSNEQVKEYLANVRNASYHTYTLLENLLEWSRIQSGKMPFTPTIFDIHNEVSSVISVLDNNATQKEILLINEVDKGIMVEADRNMIHSVIQNIITNSIKFSNAKGRVVVRARVPQTYVKSKTSVESDDRHWLEVSISDNGIGIPDEILPKLFKLDGQYSQPGTANEPGTGLGLVLCHEMVEKNGGRIWAESIAGQGTTFVFTILLSK